MMDDERLDELVARMRVIAGKVCREMMAAMPTAADPVHDADMPPEAVTVKGQGKGRRENRKYEKVSVTVDKNLWRLFNQEKQSLRVSTSRLLDAILWRHYGRPRPER